MEMNHLGGSVLKQMFLREKVVSNALLNCLDFQLITLFLKKKSIFEQSRKPFPHETCSQRRD